jgi:hypothetical protein
LKAVEKCGVGSKGIRESNGGVEWTKVNYTHSGNTLKHPFEHQLEF